MKLTEAIRTLDQRDAPQAARGEAARAIYDFLQQEACRHPARFAEDAVQNVLLRLTRGNLPPNALALSEEAQARAYLASWMRNRVEDLRRQERKPTETPISELPAPEMEIARPPEEEHTAVKRRVEEVIAAIEPHLGANAKHFGPSLQQRVAAVLDDLDPASQARASLEAEGLPVTPEALKKRQQRDQRRQRRALTAIERHAQRFEEEATRLRSFVDALRWRRS